MTADDGEPLVSVCIPALDEEESLSAALDSVLSQTWRTLEVLVVDGGSTDATRAIVEDYMSFDPRVRLVENPRRIQSAAMNEALASARSEWLVRVDAHSTVPPTYVEGVMAHLLTGRWGGVGGRKDGVALSEPGRAIAAALGSPVGVGNSTYHHGTTTEVVDHIPFGAYPVELARSLGGWDESITCNEDFEFDYRLRQAGHQLLFDPSLVIWWRTRETLADFSRQYRRYGSGKAAVIRRHPESMALRHLVPAGLVAVLAIAAVTAPRRPRCRRRHGAALPRGRRRWNRRGRDERPPTITALAAGGVRHDAPVLRRGVVAGHGVVAVAARIRRSIGSLNCLGAGRRTGTVGPVDRG